MLYCLKVPLDRCRLEFSSVFLIGVRGYVDDMVVRLLTDATASATGATAVSRGRHVDGDGRGAGGVQGDSFAIRRKPLRAPCAGVPRS